MGEHIDNIFCCLSARKPDASSRFSLKFLHFWQSWPTVWHSGLQAFGTVVELLAELLKSASNSQL